MTEADNTGNIVTVTDTDTTETVEAIEETSENNSDMVNDVDDVNKVVKQNIDEFKDKLDELDQKIREELDIDSKIGDIDLYTKTVEYFKSFNHPDPVAWTLNGIVKPDIKDKPFTQQRLIIARALTTYCARFESDTREIRLKIIQEGNLEEWEKLTESVIEDITWLDLPEEEKGRRLEEKRRQMQQDNITIPEIGEEVEIEVSEEQRDKLLEELEHGESHQPQGSD